MIGDKDLVLTEEYVENCRTAKGGFSYEILRELGVSCPPRHGWRRELIGKRISIERHLKIQELIRVEELKAEKLGLKKRHSTYFTKNADRASESDAQFDRMKFELNRMRLECASFEMKLRDAQELNRLYESKFGKLEFHDYSADEVF